MKTAPLYVKVSNYDAPNAKIKNCQGNWRREDDLLPHPDHGNDGDQPEPLPGHGLPPREAQPADQDRQGVKKVKCHAIKLSQTCYSSLSLVLTNFRNVKLYNKEIFLKLFIR